MTHQSDHEQPRSNDEAWALLWWRERPELFSGLSMLANRFAQTIRYRGEFQLHLLLVGLEENGPVEWETSGPELPTSAFQRVIERAREFAALGDRDHDEESPARPFHRVFLLDDLSRIEVEVDGRIFFGNGIEVRGSIAIPLVSVKSKELSAIGRLTSIASEPRQPDRFQENFLLSAARRLLEEAHHELTRERPGYYMDLLGRDQESLAKDAAAGMLVQLETIPKFHEQTSVGFLFGQLNELSATPYESRPCKGQISFCPVERVPEFTLRFSSPIPLKNTRWARKIVAMTSESLTAISDGHHLFGLAERFDGPNIPIVQFSGVHHWSLSCSAIVVLDTQDGVPRLPTLRIEREDILRSLQELRDLPTAALELIAEAIVAVADAKHGALIVVHHRAEGEAKRLSRDAIAVSPRAVTPELVRAASEIDGAMLLDTRGHCHAIGVILDGPAAPEHSDPARGARYNSASRYVQAAHGDATAFILSEDGMFDVVPKLPRAALP